MHADFVPRLLFEPYRCSFTLRDQDPDGFFQGRNLTGPVDVAAISVSRVRTYAESLGYVSGETHQAALDANVQLAGERDALVEELEALRGQFEAIDLLASAGFQARKKPGRRPVEREAA